MNIITQLKNEYGNIDIRYGVPDGTTHIKGRRLQPTCRACGIEFASALVDWSGTKKYPKPVMNGVIVADADTAKLITAIERKEKRNTPEIEAKRRATREKRQQAEQIDFAMRVKLRFPKIPEGVNDRIAEHACEVGSGRIGRSRVAEYHGVDSIMAAVVAYIRHNYTDYEERLADGEDREEVRADIGSEIADKINEWQKEDDDEEKCEKAATPEK